MGTRKPVTLIAFDPDGGEHTFRTAASYDWAGLAQSYPAGPWQRVAKGWSHDSVTARTRAKAAGAHSAAVVPFYVSGTNAAVKARTAARAVLLERERGYAIERGQGRHLSTTWADAIKLRAGRQAADRDFPGRVRFGDALIGADRYWRAAYETRIAQLRAAETAAGREPHQWKGITR